MAGASSSGNIGINSLNAEMLKQSVGACFVKCIATVHRKLGVDHQADKDALDRLLRLKGESDAL
eukprot:635012-Pyramimonas_sp.AAC.1